MIAREEFASHPDLRAILRRQAHAFLAVERDMPRLAAVFATHQRYLLAQLAIAMTFESAGRGMLLTHYLDAVQHHGMASRNTAEAFVREMLHYGFATLAPPPKDRRARPILVNEPALSAIAHWLALHLDTLDSFDGGTRLARYLAEPDIIARVHPLIVRNILASERTRDPGGIFALFTWMNDGGLLMDNMIANLGEELPEGGRVVTAIRSFAELSEPLRITRAHLSRRIALSERDGHLGWMGKRGASPLWVSTAFIGEYDAYQTDKLAHIAAAFDAVSG